MQITRVVLFGLILSIMILGLLILNTIPSMIQEQGMRNYSSIEAAQKEAGLERVFLPAYFPQRLSWPPAEILAQGAPFPLLLVHFSERDSGRLVLAIRQVEYKHTAEAQQPRLAVESIRSRESIILKGRKAELLSGKCRETGQCVGISWQEADFELRLVGQLPPEEMLRMAESMVRE